MTNQQCQSTEGSSSPKDRLQSHQVHIIVLQYYTCMQYTVIQKIHTYTKMNLSTGKWTQWDKTQSRELLGLFICVCNALCQLLRTILHRTDLKIFPLNLQTITIAEIMSIWGKGVFQVNNAHCARLESGKHQQPPNSPDLNSFDYHIRGAMPRQKSAAKAEPKTIAGTLCHELSKNSRTCITWGVDDPREGALLGCLADWKAL